MDEITRPDPYDLPRGFQWDCDVTINELHDFLSKNYVGNSLFRLDCTVKLLQWVLSSPNCVHEWRVGVRMGTKLVGFISAIPAKIVADDSGPHTTAEINFLCVDHALRSKRMTPVLIMEITRRINLRGIYRAVFTSGANIQKPIATCQYYHRPLNPKKLIDAKFLPTRKNMTLARTIKLYSLPKLVSHRWRLLEPRDCPAACDLLMKYLSKFALHPIFDAENFAHWFLPKDNIVYCYVLDDGDTITDMCSFYSLPSRNNDNGLEIITAYSWYNVATSMSMTQLIADLLILARDQGFDLFNCLDALDNADPVGDLKFIPGDGYLKYYLRGWSEGVSPDKIGLILP